MHSGHDQVERSGEKGEDQVSMLSTLISPAGKILRLEMQGMCVANPLQLDLDLLDERGVQIGRTLFATVNRLP